MYSIITPTISEPKIKIIRTLVKSKQKKENLRAARQRCYKKLRSDPERAERLREKWKINGRLYRQRTNTTKYNIPPPTKRKVNYLNNRDLLKQVIVSKKKGKMSDELANMLMLLVKRYALKSNWNGYTYNEDFQGEALMNLCKSWHMFNEKKYSNAFAFYTQAIKNSFIQILNKERKYRNIRDALLVNSGQMPSNAYQQMIRDEINKELDKVALEPEEL